MKPKSVLCLVLILAMLFLFPVSSFAAQAEPTAPAEETTAEEAASGQPGEAPALTDDPAPVFPAPAKGDAVLWDEEKGTLARILIPGRANESETAAAALLADYLEKLTGVAPETVSADTAGYLAEYYAKGNTGAFIVLSVGEGGGKTGSYTMKTGANRSLYITGNDPRGLFNGVYDFLREYGGVNLYSVDVITAPRTAQITVPADLDVSYAPVLEYADTDFISPHDPQFAVANGLNGIYSPIEPVYGGRVKYITFAHSLTTSIVPAAELLESNPTYFALQKNGKRTGDQLCLSNPNVVNRAIEDVLRLIGEGYDETAPLNIISVTQNDNQKYCTCENCAAIAERYGGQSGLMLWFVNQIADAVAASDHPDVVVDTFAYQYTRKAPTGIRPKENVCVRLCSIECCFAHALSDASCERNAAFMQDLKDWAALSDRLYIWDYTTNYSQTIGLFPDFGVLQQNAQAFAENSVVGVYEEGAYYADQVNTEFADLRAYLIARFLRDPYEPDPTALRNGFLSAYYGDGAEEIGAFLDYITEHAGDDEGHLCIYYPMRDSLHGVTKEDVKMLDALWDAALEKTNAMGDPAPHARVERSRVSWEYYKACVGLGEYRRGLNVSRWVRANAALIEQLDALGVTRYNEGKTMEDLSRSPWQYPHQWGSPAGAGYIVCICLAAVALALAALTAAVCYKRRRLTVILPLIAADIIGLAVYTRAVFRAWDNVPLYFLLMVLLGLLTALFAVFAAYAIGGFERMPFKKWGLALGVGTLAAVIPYNIIILIVNNAVYKGHEPGYAICFAFCWLALLLIADCAAVLVCALRKRK